MSDRQQCDCQGEDMTVEEMAQKLAEAFPEPPELAHIDGQRFPEGFNGRGNWLVTRMGPGGLEVEVFTDEAVTDWPTLLDERYLEIGS